MKKREMKSMKAAKHIAAMMIAVCMMFTFVLADAANVSAASTSSSSAETIAMGSTIEGEFRSDDGGLGEQTHWYKFTTDDSEAAYVVTAEYTDNDTDASNDGLEIRVKDSKYNNMTSDDEYSVNKMWLSAPGNCDSMTFESLKGNTTYYISVNTSWMSSATEKGYVIGVFREDRSAWEDDEDDIDDEDITDWEDEDDEDEEAGEFIVADGDEASDDEGIAEEDEEDEDTADEEIAEEDEEDEDAVAEEIAEGDEEDEEAVAEEADEDEAGESVSSKETKETTVNNTTVVKEKIVEKTVRFIDRFPFVRRIFRGRAPEARPAEETYIVNNYIESDQAEAESSADDEEEEYIISDGSKYQLFENEVTGSRTASLAEAANKKKIVMPASLTDTDGTEYKVNGIKAGAFSKSDAKKIVIKSKDMGRLQVKDSLFGSEVKTVKVRPSFLFFNLKYIKAYKDYFAAGNSGKEVKVW